LLGEGQPGLMGTRTDGSAHTLMRAASGIEMALWDLAGKLLNTPVSILLGGRFRDHVRVYDHSWPRDLFDKGSCRDWAAQVREHPSGFTAHKIDIPRILASGEAGVRSEPDVARDPANRHLTSQELARIARGFANVREAIGWDHDLMVHCHWDLDVPSAIQLAGAIADIKPLWLEDPLPVNYTEAWKHLAESSPVSPPPFSRARTSHDERDSRHFSSMQPATSSTRTCATAAAFSKPSVSPIWLRSTVFP